MSTFCKYLNRTKPYFTFISAVTLLSVLTVVLIANQTVGCKMMQKIYMTGRPEPTVLTVLSHTHVDVTARGDMKNQAKCVDLCCSV